MKPQINKWATVIIAVLFAVLIVMPLIRNDIGLARNPQNYMSKGWQETTQYLRSQLTPEQEADYYKIYQLGWQEVIQPAEYCRIYQKKEKTTTPHVLTWWDYGYWIVREAHMPVICSPGGGSRVMAAQLLMSKNYYLGIWQLKRLSIKYIVIDSQTAVEKFYAVVAQAGLDLDRYYFKVSQSHEVQRTDAYYETFLAQLYLYDAEHIYGIDKVFESKEQITFRELINPTLKEFDEWDIPEVKVFEVKVFEVQ